MYRLKIISGPLAGKSFELSQGETSLGRVPTNEIVLKSDNVSKRHTLIIVQGAEVILRDQKSSNGTFVNGILTKAKKLKIGDRISIGDYVFELKRSHLKAQPFGTHRSSRHSSNYSQAALPADMLQLGNVIAVGSQRPQLHEVPQPHAQFQSQVPQVQVPTDIKEKFFWYFENYVMPFFYNLNLKQDWKSVSMMVFGAFVVLNLLVSVYPLMESNRRMVIEESARRARFIARQLAERNSSAISSGVESRADIGTVDRDDGVIAYLTDLDNRIIAPTTRANQYLASGSEATVAVTAARQFKRGREIGVIKEMGDNTVVAVEPIKAFDSKTGRNAVLAMAVVSVDASLSIPTGGGLSLVFSESFVLAALLAGLTLLILYRLTLKPFEVLNEDIDRVLKGDAQQITHEFKSEELIPLWDVIRSALQRLPRSGSGDMDALGTGASWNPQDLEPLVRLYSDSSGCGVVLCDSEQKVIFLNDVFEDASGIRAADSVGQDFSGLARDQAFSAVIKDLFERSQLGGSATEDFEFSGNQYKISSCAVGNPSPKAYVFIFKKEGA